MKIILLFIFFVAFRFAAAQQPMKHQVNRSIVPKSFNELAPVNANYIALYLRAETHTKIFTKFFDPKAIKAGSNPVNDFTYFSNAQVFHNVNRIYLNTKGEIKRSQLVMNNISAVLGNMFDTFFQQYSISNKIIY